MGMRANADNNWLNSLNFNRQNLVFIFHEIPAMTMTQQLYIDGIGAISVIGHTVRIDFAALSPTEKDEQGEPKATLVQRVVMTREGFLQCAARIQAARVLIEKAENTKSATETSAPSKTALFP
jgi:hypothetical protein